MYAAGVNPVETYKRAGNMRERERERERERCPCERASRHIQAVCVCVRALASAFSCVHACMVRAWCVRPCVCMYDVLAQQVKAELIIERL